MSSLKRRAVIALGILISVFFLWYSLRGTDFTRIGQALVQARFGWCVPMLAAYGAYYWIKAIRWRMLLVPMTSTTARAIFSPMMIGFMFNNILPAHMGEFVRMYLGARQLKLRNTQVLATIVLERVFDMMSVVLFFLLALLVARNVDPVLMQAGTVIAVGGVAFLILMVAYIVWTDRFLDVLRRLSFFVPRLARMRGLGWLNSIRDGILHQLEIGVAGLYALKQPRLLVGILITSLAQWGFMGLSAFLAMEAVGIPARIEGVQTQVSAAFVVLAATTFGVTLPAAPGFLGTIQAMFKVALVPFGVSETAAFAASAFFHVPTYLIVTIPGLWLLKRTGYKLKEVRDEAEAEAADSRLEG